MKFIKRISLLGQTNEDNLILWRSQSTQLFNDGIKTAFSEQPLVWQGLLKQMVLIYSFVLQVKFTFPKNIIQGGETKLENNNYTHIAQLSQPNATVGGGSVISGAYPV